MIGMEDTILDSIKLESPGNHLLNELAKGVEQDNRLKGLGSVVGWFARLRNNDKDRLLEVLRLVSQSDTRVGEGKNTKSTDVIS